ncbi:MAG: sulfate transporter,permease protein, partial [Phenylobacterium sp.]|nr:sulfate transporter,permease protein [Phenylobacterium sp.]
MTLQVPALRPSSLRLPGIAPLLVAASVAVMGGLVILPLAIVFHDAFAKGLATYLAALKDPDAQAAIRLT